MLNTYFSEDGAVVEKDPYVFLQKRSGLLCLPPVAAGGFLEALADSGGWKKELAPPVAVRSMDEQL